MVTMSRSRMPSTAACVCASRTNCVVTITAVGIFSSSRLTVSRVQHDVQDPQSAMAITATSLFAAMSRISSGAAGFVNVSFL